jgi:hypothetical protein
MIQTQQLNRKGIESGVEHALIILQKEEAEAQEISANVKIKV